MSIVAACGLKTAVTEASLWLRKARGILVKGAQSQGPDTFATLSLFPGSSALQRHVPRVHTPVQV